MSKQGFWLYRHFDASGVLLYIGKSSFFLNRCMRHAFTSPWFEQVERISAKRYASAKELRRAEKAAIEEELPRLNNMDSRYIHSEDSFTLKEAAKILHMSPQFIRQRIGLPDGPPVKRYKSRIVFPREEFLRWSHQPIIR